MSVVNIYPYFAISALLLVVAWAVSRRTRFYRELLAVEDRANRFHAIDGLRGFLALGVFFHHAVISYFYYATGRWELPPSRFYTLTAEVGVALFFMITAFLFWNRGLTARPELEARKFYWSRICRLVPMYLFSVACVFGVAYWVTGFEFSQSIRDLFRESMKWVSFGFLNPYDLNGLRHSWVLNSVYWTLAYEWMFYLFLPLGLLFARSIGFVLLVLIASVFIHAAYAVKPVEWNFLFGAVAAVLSSEYRWSAWRFWRSRIASVFVLVALVLFFAAFDRGYGLAQASLLFPIFLCIANGNDLWGLLAAAPSRLLGTISYSIYLMHSIVLFGVLWWLNQYVPIAGMGALEYWLLISVVGVLVVIICSATYRVIEHPLLRTPIPKWLGVHAGESTTGTGQ